MDFGILTAKVDEIGYITHAENLGFSHAWITDSLMIRSNCWRSWLWRPSRPAPCASAPV